MVVKKWKTMFGE